MEKKNIQTQAMIKILKNQKQFKETLDELAESIDLLVQIMTDKVNKEKYYGRKQR
jgi:hypothetical protein